MGIQWMVHWWVLVASGCYGSQNYLVCYLTLLKPGEWLGDPWERCRIGLLKSRQLAGFCLQIKPE